MAHLLYNVSHCCNNKPVYSDVVVLIIPFDHTDMCIIDMPIHSVSLHKQRLSNAKTIVLSVCAAWRRELNAQTGVVYRTRTVLKLSWKWKWFILFVLYGDYYFVWKTLSIIEVCHRRTWSSYTIPPKECKTYYDRMVSPSSTSET